MIIIIIMDYRSSDETERHCCTLVWLLSSIRETMNNHIILGALCCFYSTTLSGGSNQRSSLHYGCYKEAHLWTMCVQCLFSVFELQKHFIQRNISYIRGFKPKWVHDTLLQKMLSRWGNDYNTAPVILHLLLTKSRHTLTQLIIVPICCVLPADTHGHTDGHTDHLSPPGNAQISATYSLLSKHSQKEWHHLSETQTSWL